MSASSTAANPPATRPVAAFDRATVTRPDPADPVLIAVYSPAGPVTVRLPPLAAAWLAADLARHVAGTMVDRG